MMNRISRDAIAEKMDLMKNAADHMVKHTRSANTIACLDAYALTIQMPKLNPRMLMMTAYPGTD